MGSPVYLRRPSRQLDRVDRSELVTYLRTFDRYPPIVDRDELAHVHQAFLKDPEGPARDALIGSVVRFIAWIAKQHGGRGVSLVDLVQIGVVDLLKYDTLKRFEPERGYALTTFIAPSVARAMEAAAATDGWRLPFRLTLRTERRFKLLRHVMFGFQRTYGRRPTPEELHQHVVSYGSKLTTGITLDTIVECLSLMETRLQSLDARVGETTRSWQERVADQRCPIDVAVEAQGEIRKRRILSKVERALRALPDRERAVLVDYHGLAGEDPKTYKEIAIRLGMKRQRACQLSKQALQTVAVAVQRPQGWIVDVLSTIGDLGIPLQLKAS